MEGNQFMPEIHLKQPRFTMSKSSACGPFNKNKEKIEKLMQTGNTNFIYKNDTDEACSQHYMAYSKYDNLSKGTQSHKVLKDKAFKIASSPKEDR